MKKYLILLVVIAIFSSCEKNVIGDFEVVTQTPDDVENSYNFV